MCFQYKVLFLPLLEVDQRTETSSRKLHFPDFEISSVLLPESFVGGGLLGWNLNLKKVKSVSQSSVIMAGNYAEPDILVECRANQQSLKSLPFQPI